MRSLCLMMVLVTGAMALHRGASDEVDKRLAIGPLPGGLIEGGLVGGLIGDGGLVGGLIGDGGLVGGLIGDGGLVGGLVGGEGGLVGGLGGIVGDLLSGLLNSGGGIVEELGNLAVFLVRLEEGAFKGVLDTALGLADGLLESVLGVIASVTKGLAGKTTQPEIYAEFKKHKLESLCPACDALPNPKHAQACNQYCREQNWSLK